MRRQTSLITPQMLLIQSLGLLLLGALILVKPEWVNAFLQTLLVTALFGNAALTLITLFTHAKNSAGMTDAARTGEGPSLPRRIRCLWDKVIAALKAKGPQLLIISAALSVILGIIVAACPKLIAGGFGLGFGLWALFNGVVQLLYALQLHSTGTHGAVKYLVLAITSLLFGLMLVINPISRIVDVKIVAGLYFLIYGFSVFVNFLEAMFKWDMENSRFIARIKISPPVVITSFLPVWLLDRFNRMLERDNTNHIYEKPEGTVPAADISDTRLEILFHLGKNVAMGYGHVDFALGDTVYSYGCYDDASNRVMGLYSDGTFMVAKLKPYLDYCIRWQKKTLVSFTMQLTKAQERSVRSALARVLGQCRRWHTTARNSPAIGLSAHASSIFDVQYYKVISGPFKIYSALKTNCVAMAEILVGESGLKILPSHGIITPGSYYAFMDRQLKAPGSPIIRKTIYKINGKRPRAGKAVQRPDGSR